MFVPSRLAITSGRPYALRCATTELVVPRSMPTKVDMGSFVLESGMNILRYQLQYLIDDGRRIVECLLEFFGNRCIVRSGVAVLCGERGQAIGSVPPGFKYRFDRNGLIEKDADVMNLGHSLIPVSQVGF